MRQICSYLWIGKRRAQVRCNHLSLSSPPRTEYPAFAVYDTGVKQPRLTIPPASRREHQTVLFDLLRLTLLVDRDIGEIAVGDQDRLCLLAARYPGFEMDGDRGAADTNELAIDGDEVADIDRFSEVHRVDR